MGFFKKSDLKKSYKLGEQLGSGNFAVVRKADNLNAKKNGFPIYVAVKVIDKSKVEDMQDIQVPPELL